MNHFQVWLARLEPRGEGRAGIAHQAPLMLQFFHRARWIMVDPSAGLQPNWLPIEFHGYPLVNIQKTMENQ